MGPDVTADPVLVQSTALLRVTGRVTGETAPAVVAAAKRAAAVLPALSVLILDLRTLELLAGSGVRALTMAAEEYAAREVRCCVVVNPGSTVAAVLDATVPRGVLPRFPDIDHALTGAVTELDIDW